VDTIPKSAEEAGVAAMGGKMQGKSPCLSCERRDLDKTVCADACKRLEAYQRGEDYRDVDVPGGAETKGAETGHTENDPGPTCCFCSGPGPLTRNLCRGCYSRWHQGYIQHPTEGEYRRVKHSTRHRADRSKKADMKEKQKPKESKYATERRLLAFAEKVREEMAEIRNNLHTRLCVLEDAVNEGEKKAAGDAGLEERIENLEKRLKAHSHDQRGAACILVPFE